MSQKIVLSSGIILIKSALTSDECSELIALADASEFKTAPVQANKEQIVVLQVRNNERATFVNDELANMLWPKVQYGVPTQWCARPAVGLNEYLRLYRYSAGQFFDWHRDDKFQRENGQSSYFTVLFYLNDDYAGGETEFETSSFRQSTGDALIFRHDLLHRGGTVLTGTKYVLRTDVMYDRLGA